VSSSRARTSAAIKIQNHASIAKPAQNYLLAVLPPEEFARLSAHLELVTLRLGKPCTSLAISCSTCIFRPLQSSRCSMFSSRSSAEMLA